MKFEETHYIGYDGHRMFMACWLPENDKPRAILVTIHGLGSHALDMKNIGEYFADRGIAVFAPDLRGFGHFDGLKGHIMRFDEYVEDIHNVIMQVKDRYRNKITFLHGHSLGGQLVIRYATEYQREIDGLLLNSPGVSQSLKIGVGSKILAQILSLLNTKNTIANGVVMEHTTRNKEVVAEHEADSLRYDYVTPRFAAEGLSSLKKAFKSAPFLTIPILFQQAGDDKIVVPERNKEFFESIASADKTWFLYEGLYHETFNEPEKERVLQDMENWLEKRLPT